MPLYPMVCLECGHKFEVVAPASDAPKLRVCPNCDALEAHQDYQAKGSQVGMIDGETSGYYPRETGFPKDPTNPMKRIAPGKAKAIDAFKRANDETKGRVAGEAI